MSPLPPSLAQLDAVSCLASSELPAGLRRRLAPLFQGGVLTAERSGAGERVVLRNRDAWRRWLEANYPSAGTDTAVHPDLVRSQAIAQRRDSKSAREPIHATPLLMRVSTEHTITLRFADHPLPVSSWCAIAGCAAVLLTDSSRLDLPVSVALIENLESFLHHEALLPAVPLALLSAGRPSERLIACLDRSLTLPGQLLHLPDYDPVGLDDHLRLHAILGDRVRLHLPQDLEDRFRRFSKRSLIEQKPRNQELFVTLASTRWPNSETARVFDLIRSHGAGLEQEALWIQSLAQKEQR